MSPKQRPCSNPASVCCWESQRRKQKTNLLLLSLSSRLFFSILHPPASKRPTPPPCHPSCLRCSGDTRGQTTCLWAAGSSKSETVFPQPKVATLRSVRQHHRAAWRGNKELAVKGASRGFWGRKNRGLLSRSNCLSSHLVEQEVVWKLTLKITSQMCAR